MTGFRGLNAIKKARLWAGLSKSLNRVVLEAAALLAVVILNTTLVTLAVTLGVTTLAATLGVTTLGSR
jgi:hypothetical protein